MPAEIILLAAAIIVAGAALLIWRRRSAPGGIILFWLMGALLIWTFSNAMEAAMESLNDKLIWSKISYLGVSSASPLLLLFSLTYTRREKWITRRNRILLWIIPVASVILAATNEFHNLIWESFTFVNGPLGGNLLIYEHGAAFWVIAAYSYLCAITAIVLLFDEYRQINHFYKMQVGAVLIGAAMPLVGSAIYLLDPNLFPGVDPTVISFAFTGLILTLAVTKTRLLDLIPIAHDILLHNMQDGVIVIGPDNRIVETNPAVAVLLDQTHIPRGEDAFETFKAWPALASVLVQKPSLPSEIILPGNPTRYLDARITPILSPQERRDGYLAVLREITERKQAEFNLELKSREMEQRSITDDLTGLYNRRHLDKFLEQEFRRSERYGPALSLALFDIDDFKQINDNFGHHAGDEALQTIANTLRSALRSTDIPARMGGDEFLVIMPHTELENAWRVMERIRIELLNKPVVKDKARITISAGVTAWFAGDTPDEALKRVDRLLYQAKERGKNQVVKSQ